MSSAVFSTSAAQSRPFIFEENVAEVRAEAELRGDGRPSARVRLAEFPADPRLSSIMPASRLDVRPAPEMASSGIAAIDALTGGLPRGCLTEICGPASSGRTTILLAALAAATCRGEFCAIVDASDALDPHSVAAAGVELNRLLWVRCGKNFSPKAREKTSQAAFKFAQTESQHAQHCLEQLLRATDLLLESGGFGLIVLDICDVTPQAARRIPLTTWFRFRRAVEHKPTVLLALEQHTIAGSCSSLLLKLSVLSSQFSVLSSKNNSREHARVENGCGDQAVNPQLANEKSTKPAHVQLLTGLNITAELIRSRFGNSQFINSPLKTRKPSVSVSATFASKTAWAG